MLDILRLTKILQHYCRQIEDAGFQVRLSADFVELKEVTEANGDVLTPHFSPVENTYVRSEAIWVGVWDQEQCIATIACKVQNLGSESLADYVCRYWPQSYLRGSSTQILPMEQQKRSLKSFTGKMVYCGEFRVSSKHRKSFIGRWLASLMKTLTFINWPDAEHIYIFMDARDAASGLLAAIEMTRQIPNAINWVSAPSQAKSDYWLAALSNSDFADWVDDQFRYLSQLPSKE